MKTLRHQTLRTASTFLLTSCLAATLAASESNPKQVEAAPQDIPNCSSRLFERLIAVEKTAHRLPIRTAKGKLKTYVDYYEDICPWRREADVNGDKRRDWVGIVGERGKYSLIAYVTAGITYKIHTIKKYEKFPEETYIDVISSDEAKKLTGKAHKTVAAKYAITENKLGGISTAWYWNGKAFVELGGFLDETKMPAQASEASDEDD